MQQRILGAYLITWSLQTVSSTVRVTAKHNGKTVSGLPCLQSFMKMQVSISVHSDYPPDAADTVVGCIHTSTITCVVASKHAVVH
jgi:hypothetical protein